MDDAVRGVGVIGTGAMGGIVLLCSTVDPQYAAVLVERALEHSEGSDKGRA